MDRDVFKTSSGHLKKVTMSYDQLRCCPDIWKRPQIYEDVQFTMSWRRLIYNVFRASGLWHPEDVWFTFSWRRPIWDILKTSVLQRFQDVWFTMSWRCLIYVILKTFNLWRLEDIWFMTSWRCLIYDVLKMSVKRHLCSNIITMSIHRQKK